MRLLLWTPARRSASLFVAASTFASAMVGGCIIFTGGTGDYSLVDSGQKEAAAITCPADAECITETCVSASDCDAGEVCCLTASISSLGSTCQAAPCTEAQICTGNAECDDGGKTCTLQQCSSSGVSVTLQACGAIPGCSQ